MERGSMSPVGRFEAVRMCRRPDDGQRSVGVRANN